MSPHFVFHSHLFDTDHTLSRHRFTQSNYRHRIDDVGRCISEIPNSLTDEYLVNDVV